MDVKEVTKPVTPEKKNRSGWLVAAAAFAVVIAVLGVALLVNQPTDEAPPASTPPTTTAAPDTTAPTTTAAVASVSAEDQLVLDAFVASLNSGDVAAFRSLFDTGVRRVGEWEGSYDDDLNGLAIEAEHKSLRGTSSALEDCVPSGDRVNCMLISDGPVELAIFQVPRRETYSFLIEDGLILEINAKCQICSDGAETDRQIRTWAAQFHPEAREIMGAYHADPVTVESALLWRDYAPLWREAKKSGTLDEVAEAMAAVVAYETSWNTGDVDAFASVFALDAQRIELVNDVELASDRDLLVAEMAAYVAQGATIDVHSCSIINEAIRCTITTAGPVVEALVFRDKTDTATFTVVDGVITELGWVCRDCLIGMETETNLVQWMRSQYPDEAEELGSTVVGLRDAQVAGRWAELAQEWIDAGRP